MEPAEKDKLQTALDPKNFWIVRISVVTEENDGRGVFGLRSRIHGGELNMNRGVLEYTGKLGRKL